ncbi:MAG TPA: NAD(P)H-hydrate epimerase [Thermomicrobiales bacterium]|nr:NAD(P)H-hydrate epimerase [Thermomicrobiales bacterium]
MTGIPAVSASQMAYIDRLMADRFGVLPIQLMEHAGHAVASFVRMSFPGGDARDQPVVLLAGSGGNGGDALVAARLLAAWGAKPVVVPARPANQVTGLVAEHLRAIEAFGIPVLDGAGLSALPPAAVIVDGLLGSGATGEPTGTTASLIELANQHDAEIIAIDVPSGLDATTGAVPTPCIVASCTLTLGLPKTGLLAKTAAHVTGTLMLADIGIPAAAYRHIGVDVPADLFSATWLVPVLPADDDGAPTHDV